MGLSIVYAKNGTRLFVDFFSLLFSFFDILFWTFEANCTKSFWGQMLDIFDIFWYNCAHKGVVCTLCGKVNIMALRPGFT